MGPSNKALWYIESRLRAPITLDEVAQHAEVSRFHLSRAFGVAVGVSVTRYIRARRLSEAAKSLAGGAGNILMVAFDAGYSSHEAFTRAFRQEFGMTPESLRDQRHLGSIELKEAFKMDETLLTELAPPRFADGKTLLIAGLSERYSDDTVGGIPGQWQRFGGHIGTVPNQVGDASYGVCCNSDEAGNIDYITGVEVSDFDGLPADWARIRIPAQRYAVFHHKEHISQIRRTWHTVFDRWLPGSGHELLDAPSFERYDNRFDPETGMGGLEIWIPLKA
ncbi:MAG: GyrI-like domain-containing protein [Geminicoccaceae bacterium]